MARIHSIITVTEGGILYKDIAEVTRWVDFKLCNRNWYRQAEQRPSPYTHNFDKCCVARRSFENAPLAYIEFFTEPISRLEFDDTENLWDLLKQMKIYGNWVAYDLD
ncbi:MAG: hypothetical protein Phog2KO_05280 [Phototrophicaceae bacterium]